jgi:ABC-type dipeptide/oligopeptide/nickel transport system permease component
MALTLLGVSIISFVLFRLVPGDPVLALLPPNATPQDISALRHKLGLDQPIYVQYVIWLKDALQGNFGTSIRFGVPAMGLILSKLPVTLTLIISAEIIALVFGILIGTTSVSRKEKLISRVASSFSFLGFAIPDFLWGIIFIVIFGAILRILPVEGIMDLSINLTTVTGFPLLDALLTGNSAAFLSVLEHLILPSVALALPQIASIQRTIRSSLLDVSSEDYILTDRAKGLPERYIFYVRALKNALIPTVTLTGVQFAFVLGGSVLIELVFALPGIGNLVFVAVKWKDLPVMQGIVVVYAVIVVVTAFGIDLLYSYLNPKIRFT